MAVRLRRVRITVALLAMAALAGSGCGAGRRRASAEDVALGWATAVRRHLDSLPPPSTPRQQRRDAWQRRFYQRRHYAPAWIGPGGVPRRTAVLLDALDGAAAHGLPPAAYGARRWRTRLGARPVDVACVAALDVALTAAFMAYADDLRRGAVDPAAAGPSWQVRRPPADLSGLLETAIALDAVGESLARLAPRALAYRRLQAALAAARSAGDSGATRRLRANLERWRWLPRDLGEQYLLVRIADFELDWVWGGHRHTRHVVVGGPFRQTPQFASQVRRVVVHPPWYVPPRIADEELAPRLRTDPEGLAAAGFEVWSHDGRRLELAAVSAALAGSPDAAFSSRYRLVQRPGGSNPLGRVKLDLDTPFAVYLHDTPGTDLFARPERDLSHGCIRVQGAVDLARELLSPEQRPRFDRLLAAGRTAVLELEEPVTTYVLYWTASVTAAGEVHWADDVYGVDAPLLARLDTCPAVRSWTRGCAGAP